MIKLAATASAYSTPSSKTAAHYPNAYETSSALVAYSRCGMYSMQ